MCRAIKFLRGGISFLRISNLPLLTPKNSIGLTVSRLIIVSVKDVCLDARTNYEILFTYLWPHKKISMLKIGVFGVGHLGKYHLSNWQQIEGVELVGFFDPSDVAVQEISNKYQLARFIDAERLIDAVDAVDIVAPTTFHFELCRKAIRKGKHVFVEKPLANTMDEARELLKLTRSRT